jgi:ELWxxDGT repeat protein
MKHAALALAAWLSMSVWTSPAAAYLFYNCKVVHPVAAPQMLADINPGGADAISIIFGYAARDELMIDFGGALLFQADDGVHGAELWRRSGGAPVMVDDIRPGPQGSAPHAFATFDSKLYFAATTAATGEELFVYDGTSVALAADITPGPQGGEIGFLTVYNGALYFTRVGQNGSRVWRFDGSTAAEVAAINQVGFIDQLGVREAAFTVFNGRLYFVARTGLPDHYELWAFDGAGVQKIRSLTEGDNITSYDFGLAVYNGALYFGVVAGATWPQTDQLWRYSGSGSPVMVAGLGGSAHSFSQPRDFEIFNGKLYFVAQNDLYRYDGQALTNVLGPNFAYGLTAYSLGGASGIYLRGSLGSDWMGVEPYTYAPAVGASLIANIKPDNAQYPGSFATRAVQSGGRVFFYADNEANGYEVWSFGPGLPFLECDIVVAPIWDNWLEWPVGPREVVVETHLIAAGRGGVQRVSQQTLRVTRDMPAQTRAFSTEAASAPEAFALHTIVRDRETGAVVDRAFEIFGAPNERDAARLVDQARQLESRRAPRR